jgi:hypothetical protein
MREAFHVGQKRILFRTPGNIRGCGVAKPFEEVVLFPVVLIVMRIAALAFFL